MKNSKTSSTEPTNESSTESTNQRQLRPRTTSDVESSSVLPPMTELSSPPASASAPPGDRCQGHHRGHNHRHYGHHHHRQHHRDRHHHSLPPMTGRTLSTDTIFQSGSDLRSSTSDSLSPTGSGTRTFTTNVTDDDIHSQPSTIPPSETNSGASTPSINIYHHLTPPPTTGTSATSTSICLPPLTAACIAAGGHMPAHIPIYVETLTGVTFEMQVTPDETVLQVKQKLEFAEGIAANKQHLLWQGQELKDDYTLDEYNVNFGAILKLVLGVKVGPLAATPILSSSLWATGGTSRLPQTAKDGDDDDSRPLTVLVFRDGDQIRLFTISTTTSAATTANAGDGGTTGGHGGGKSPPSRPASGARKQREHDSLRDKMSQLQLKMKSLNLKRTNQRLNKINNRINNNRHQNVDHHQQQPSLHASLYQPVRGGRDAMTTKLPAIPKATSALTNLVSKGHVSSSAHSPINLPPLVVNTKPSLVSNQTVSNHMVQKIMTRPFVNQMVNNPSPVNNATNANISRPPLAQPALIISSHASNIEMTSSSVSSTASPAAAVVHKGLPPNANEPSDPNILKEVSANDQTSNVDHCQKTVINSDDQRHQNIDATGNVSDQSFNLNKVRSNSYGHESLSEQLNRNRLFYKLCSSGATRTNADTGNSDQQETSSVGSIQTRVIIKRRPRTSPLVGNISSARKIPNFMFKNNLNKINNNSRANLNSSKLLRRRAINNSNNLGGNVGGTAAAVGGASTATKCHTSKLRCSQCRRKLPLAARFECRCSRWFCGQHRYSELHSCDYDYKTEGQRLLAAANPRVQAAKLPKI